MSEIQYMIKPDWISWDEVQECQRKAHEATNNGKGIHMTVQDISGDDLRQYIEENGNGYCFIALDGRKVVGLCGLKLFVGTRWWSWKKKVAYNCIDGILPEYQGSEVYFGLNEIRMKYIMESGAELIQSNTAENNKRVRKIAKMRNGKIVQFSATGRGADYYSVIIVKWLNGCPFSDRFINFMFNLSKIVVKTIWKPGYKVRFWFS